MNAILLDTHAWAWTFTLNANLTQTAHFAIEQAQSVYVSPISFFEIAQKFRLGKWPEVGPFVDRMVDIVEEQGSSVAALVPEVAKLAGAMEFRTRDPFDRMLAATAIHLDLPIVSSDSVFDGVVTRIW